jgi:hypothetical protein
VVRRRFRCGPRPATDLYLRLRPWSAGRSLYNFTTDPRGRVADARAAFDEEDGSHTGAVADG